MHLLPAGSTRAGYPFQLPAIHSCQSNKGFLLQGVVQRMGTELQHRHPCCKRERPPDIKTIKMGTGSGNWRKNSLWGNFHPITFLLASTREQTGKAEGAGGQHLRGNHDSMGLPTFCCSRIACPMYPSALSWGLEPAELCWRMPVVGTRVH